MTLRDVTARRLANVIFTAMAVALPLLAAGLVWALAVNKIQSDDLKAQLAQITSGAHLATQQNVSARYDACVGGNRLRAALRADVWESKRNQPLLYKLFPQLDTPQIRELSKQSRARKLKAYADLDCAMVALAVVPPRQRKQFRVP